MNKKQVYLYAGIVLAVIVVLYIAIVIIQEPKKVMYEPGEVYPEDTAEPYETETPYPDETPPITKIPFGCCEQAQGYCEENIEQNDCPAGSIFIVNGVCQPNCKLPCVPDEFLCDTSLQGADCCKKDREACGSGQKEVDRCIPCCKLYTPGEIDLYTEDSRCSGLDYYECYMSEYSCRWRCFPLPLPCSGPYDLFCDTWKSGSVCCNALTEQCGTDWKFIIPYDTCEEKLIMIQEVYTNIDSDGDEYTDYEEELADTNPYDPNDNPEYPTPEETYPIYEGTPE